MRKLFAFMSNLLNCFTVSFSRSKCSRETTRPFFLSYRIASHTYRSVKHSCTSLFKERNYLDFDDQLLSMICILNVYLMEKFKYFTCLTCSNLKTVKHEKHGNFTYSTTFLVKVGLAKSRGLKWKDIVYKTHQLSCLSRPMITQYLLHPFYYLSHLFSSPLYTTPITSPIIGVCVLLKL